MKNNYKSLSRVERKTILLLCDDLRHHSGVGNIARDFVTHTAQHFNWIQIAGTGKVIDKTDTLDMSESLAEISGVSDASLTVYPTLGYGNPSLLRKVLKKHKPDAVFIFTDPRYWEWLFDMEREIRQQCPIVYLNIWDNYPAPMYNRPFYLSCDLLLSISKQTKNINEIVLGEDKKYHLIEYVPHGADPKVFYPIEDIDSCLFLKEQIFNNKIPSFTVLFNSRNIRRKNALNIMLGFKLFCDKIGKSNSKEVALIMHTDPLEKEGPNLIEAKKAFCDPEFNQVYFSTRGISSKQMNILYNITDVNILVSNAEGWGMSITEATLAGTMSIVSATGGIQDQCRFVDEKGNWINFSQDFPSNHTGKYKECGEWVLPIFPKSRTLVGSQKTPYIYQDNVDAEQIAEELLRCYNMSSEERKRRGLRGREWFMSEEAGFTSIQMSNRIIDACDKLLERNDRRKDYELYKVSDYSDNKRITHSLTY